MYKKYQLSTGDFIEYDGYAYTGRIDWFGKRILTMFTVDECEEVRADSAVDLFEKVYEKRELFLMQANDFVKDKLVRSVNYEKFINPFRNDSMDIKDI